MEITINVNKAVMLTMSNLYRSEWVVIDGVEQHPEGLNFMEWLEREELIAESGAAEEMEQ